MNGEALNGSAFGNRKLLEQLIEDRVLVRIVVGRGRAKIRCPNPLALRNYLKHQFSIVDLAAYLDVVQQDVRDGEDSLKATASSKILRTGSLQGFFIKAFGASIEIGGKGLEPLPVGVEYFVSDFQSLEIPEKALVVGVENPECFTKAGRLLHLFPRKPLIFVLRYHSNAILRWLPTHGNPYLHFGDFDPAGIAIYCNEFLPILGNVRCSFFVPENFEELIAHGDPDLFDQQAHLWPPKIEIQQPELQQLVSVISRFAKGCEQEKLLQ